MEIISMASVPTPFIRKTLLRMLGALLLIGLLASAAVAQQGPLVLERAGRVISLVPYAPNIVRVTMSTDKAAATSAPGYGIIAQPSTEGWTHERDAKGYNIYRSGRMIVRISPQDAPAPKPMPLDALNLQLRKKLSRQ